MPGPGAISPLSAATTGPAGNAAAAAGPAVWRGGSGFGLLMDDPGLIRLEHRCEGEGHEQEVAAEAATP